MSEDRGPYTNHAHGDLGDARPGVDTDFSGEHKDSGEQLADEGRYVMVPISGELDMEAPF